MLAHAHPVQMPIQHQFSPFSDNGGTTVAIAGEDFCVVAADTRQSDGYEINSRYQPHTFKINNSTVYSACGCYCDTTALYKSIVGRQEWYHHQHDKPMSCPAVAQMVSTMLYGKRFFPYYVFTILGGLDTEGKGVVYSFDPVGSYERQTCRAGGSAASLIQPFLDNQVDYKNQAGATKKLPTLEQALKLAKDAFTSATERDIHTGDYLEIFIVTKDGTAVQKFDLKKD